MPDPPPSDRFELNCLLTRAESNFLQVQFKELQLVSEQDYGELRDILRHTDSIWYGEEKSVYLLGDTRELKSLLEDSEIETGFTRLIPYEEMLTKRESILRFLFYSALDRLMRRRGFLPSISRQQRSYYPQFDSREGFCTTYSMTRPDFRVIAKSGLVFDLDLSPDGPALLWIDTKLFTFVHFSGVSLEPGRPVYLLCNKAAECASTACSPLLEGGFVEDTTESPVVLPCVDADTAVTSTVRSKSRELTALVPYDYIYTTVDTHTVKELRIYDWWRPKAIPSSQERHDITWKLIRLLAQQSGSLRVPLPDDQEVVFDLQPITQRVQMRFA
jgi:hypothetical protein